jgi:hypothetical protein
MANVIIGVHGLGNKPDRYLLEHWWKISMEEGLRTASLKRLLPCFELAYWADIVYDRPQNFFEKDENDQYFITEPYKKGRKGFEVKTNDKRKKIVDFLGRQMNNILLNDDYTLNYSFITDTILNKYFRDLELYYSETPSGEIPGEIPMNRLVRQRLADLLEKHRNDEILLIGHSMGSIIAYDVLTFMKPDIRVNTFITIGSPLGLPVVLSKIAAERKARGYESDLIRTPEAVSGRWINFSDILDKVAFNYKLSEYFAENNIGVTPEDYLVVNNYEQNGEPNAHKVFGYLRTKEFTKVLNDFILSEKLTPEQKIKRSIGKLISHIRFRISGKTKKTKTEQKSIAI